MTRHMDAPMDANVIFMVLCFMYTNVDAMQYFWFFVYVDDMLWGNDNGGVT